MKVILEVLSGTTALSSVLEYILKQPLSTGGTMGDIRQLLTGVLAQSRYEQVLVQTTAKLVSLELHEALKKSLRFLIDKYNLIMIPHECLKIGITFYFSGKLAKHVLATL